MRCPKCGYISFDYLETCLKCKKNIKSASDNLPGTVYNVAPPAFLQLNLSETAESGTNELDAFVTMDDDVDGVEIQDPDLDILLDDSAGDDASGEMSFEVEGDTEFTLDIGDDEALGLAGDQPRDDSDFSLDMDAFGDEEDAFAGIDGDDADDSFKMDVPDELNDISDLEPPTGEADIDISADLGNIDASEPGSDSLSLDDDLDLGGFDLDEPTAAPAAEKKPAAGKLNLDDDLDFELDLGDLLLDDK